MSFLKPVLYFLAPIHTLSWFHKPTHKDFGYSNNTIDAKGRLDWADWLEDFRYMSSFRNSIRFPKRYELPPDTTPTFPRFSTKVETKTTIDICEVKGISASKADKPKFSDLKVMAKARVPELLFDLDIEELLSWKELKFNDPRDPDYISVWSWDDNPYLMQDGGSHHFAAAQYRAHQLGVDYPITLDLKEVSLNLDAIEALLEEVSLIYTPNIGEYSTLSNALRKAQITHTHVRSPYTERERPYGSGSVFVIPHRNRRHRYACCLLKRSYEDVGARLLELARKPYRSRVTIE
ncbi:DUF6685 family protein [Vibrio mediterranei]|uniref:DUF6685 family protein n=1 Tax=Vibrio mediterranei TaxID=689 RepID=UPI0040689925